MNTRIVAIIKPLILSFILLLALPASAFQCYLTVAKDSCWSNYDVTVKAVDSMSNQTLAEISIPKGQSWGRKLVECRPGLSIMFVASYTPVFWKNHEGRQYYARQFTVLPDTVDADAAAWEVPICFSKEFAAVPFPPDATGNCQCDFSVVPQLKLKK